MEKIELTPKESEWVATLDTFKIGLEEDYDKRISKLKISQSLAASLFQRNAIPDVRIKYFTDPEYNLSNTKVSREEYFERKGISGIEIFSEGTALKYLKYFIHGADLPESLKSELTTLKNSQFYDDDFVEKANPILKIYFKALGVHDSSSFAEEVFKLYLDLGIDLIYAKQARNKVMTWR